MNTNELATMVAQKVGISEAQAQQAVDVVLGQLRSRLPAPLAGQLDGLLGGGAGGGAAGTGGKPGAGDIAKGIGGLFGR